MTGILYSFVFCTFQWKRMIDSAELCIIHIDIAMAYVKTRIIILQKKRMMQKDETV